MREALALEKEGDPRVFEAAPTSKFDNSSQGNWRYTLDMDAPKAKDRDDSDTEDEGPEPIPPERGTLFTYNSEARRYLEDLLAAFEEEGAKSQRGEVDAEQGKRELASAPSISISACGEDVVYSDLYEEFKGAQRNR